MRDVLEEPTIVQPIVHAVRLSSAKQYGRRVPPAPLGALLQQLEGGVRRSILMAFEGQSTTTGRPRAWCTRASDVRLVDLDGNADTILRFEAPPLGEAAEELYRQVEIWPTMPPPSWTGFDLFARVLHDVGAANADSEQFDKPFLKHLGHFGRLFDDTFAELRIEEHQAKATGEAVLNRTTIETARRLSASTPPSREVRVVGRLDMLRVSTQSFAIQLEDGEEVRGVLTEGGISATGALLNKRVLVLGRAVYRPSGRLLRLDAEEITDGEGQSSLWSKVPGPLRQGISASEWRKPQTATTGVNAFFGKWPGDESDEELLGMLDDLR